MAALASPNEHQRLVVIRRFRDLPDALLFRSILDSAAIDSFLADEHTIRMNWPWSNALGGIKLCVRASDVEDALGLLAQPVPEKFDVEGVGEFQQPRCANCNSLEVSFQGLNKAVDYVRALLGGPRPLHRSIWHCDSCGYIWPESDQKPPANGLIMASSVLLLVVVAETLAVWLWWVMGLLRFVVLH